MTYSSNVIRRKFFCSIILLVFGSTAFGQSLNDMLAPDNPSLNLLDVSNSVVQRPKTGKEFTVSSIGLLSQGASLPKNFGFEVTPFWFNRKDIDFYKFQGLRVVREKQKATLEQRPFSELRFVKLSIGSTYNDTGSQSLLPNANHISFGIRATLFKLHGGARIHYLQKQVEAVHEVYERLGGDVTDGGSDELEKQTEKYWSNFKAIKTLRPLLLIEAATAAAWAFPGNNWEKRNFFKSAGWLNISLSLPLANERKLLNAGDLQSVTNNQNYINVTVLNRAGITRYNGQQLLKNDAGLYDLGGRLDLELERFSLGIEAVHRIYFLSKMDASENATAERVVGLIQYKVNSNLYLNGSFGKSFDDEKNLVALLGLNIGFGTKQVIEPQSFFR